MSKKTVPPPDQQQLTLLLPAVALQRLNELREESGHESIAQVAQEAVAWYLRVRSASVAQVIGALTPRLREVLELLSQGYGTKQIGRILGISARTVECHRARLFKLLEVHSSAELIRFAIRAGLVQLDD